MIVRARQRSTASPRGRAAVGDRDLPDPQPRRPRHRRAAVQPPRRAGEPASARGRRPGHAPTRSHLLLDWGSGPGPRPGRRPEPLADLPARHQRRPHTGRPRGDAARHDRARRGPGAGQPAHPRGAGHRPLGDRRRLRHAATPLPATSRSSTAATPSATDSSSGASRHCRTSRSSRPAPASCTRSTSSTWPASSRPRRAGRSRTSASAPTRTPPWSTASECSAGASAASRPRPSCSGESLSMLLPRVVGFRLYRRAPRGRHRHRPRPHHHRDAPPARRGREVRRVLRPRASRPRPCLTG